MKKHSIGKIVAACALSLLAGLLQPFALALVLLCIPGTVLTVVLWAWAGFVPAVVYTVSSMASLSGLYGPYMALAYALTAALPAGAVIGLLLKKPPFLQRMGIASAAQLGAIAALTVILYGVVRQDLVEALLNIVTKTVDSQPPIIQTFLLQQFALTGSLSAADAELAISGTLEQTRILELLHGVLKALGENMRLTLPGMLLSSGLLAGVLSAALGSKILSRRNEDEGYLTVDRWFMPRKVTLYAAAGLVTGIVLVALRIDGAEAVFNAFMLGSTTLYTVGGVACVSRRLKANGRGPGVRFALITACVVFASTFIAIIGVCSALFGREGIVSTWLRKKMEDQNNNDKGDF